METLQGNIIYVLTRSSYAQKIDRLKDKLAKSASTKDLIRQATTFRRVSWLAVRLTPYAPMSIG